MLSKIEQLVHHIKCPIFSQVLNQNLKSVYHRRIFFRGEGHHELLLGACPSTRFVWSWHMTLHIPLPPYLAPPSVSRAQQTQRAKKYTWGGDIYGGRGAHTHMGATISWQTGPPTGEIQSQVPVADPRPWRPVSAADMSGGYAADKLPPPPLPPPPGSRRSTCSPFSTTLSSIQAPTSWHPVKFSQIVCGVQRLGSIASRNPPVFEIGQLKIIASISSVGVWQQRVVSRYHRLYHGIAPGVRRLAVCRKLDIALVFKPFYSRHNFWDF